MSAYCGKCGAPIPMFGNVAIDLGHFCHKQLKGSRQIIINCEPDGSFEVVEEDRTTGRLCFDEMLGQVVRLAHPSIPKSSGYPMLTVNQWKARHHWMYSDKE